MIASDDTAAPAIGLGIREGEVKDGIVSRGCLAELRLRNERQIR